MSTGCPASPHASSSPPRCATNGASTGSSSPTTPGSTSCRRRTRPWATWRSAAVLALEAGIDVELPSTAAFGAPLAQALADGRVDPALVDRAVARVLRREVRARPLRGALRRRGRPRVRRSRTTAHWLARPRARRSCCWRNDGTLPLRDDLRLDRCHRAQRRQRAQPARATTRTSLTSRRCSRCATTRSASRSPTTSSLSDELEGRSTILDAVRERAGSAEVRFAAGGGVLDASDAELEEAVAAARGADVAIVVVGERSGLTLDCTCGEMRDRMDLGSRGARRSWSPPWPRQERRWCSCSWPGDRSRSRRPRERAAAVLSAWVPGDEGPAAIAEILFGDADPGGKLPVTVPRHVGQVPIYYAHKPSGGRSHWHGEYVDGSRPAAVAVRLRALLHALRAARPRARPHDARARRRAGDQRRGRERRRARRRRGRPALRARRGGERHASGQGAARLPARATGAGRAPARDLPPGRRAARLQRPRRRRSCSSPAACG